MLNKLASVSFIIALAACSFAATAAFAIALATPVATATSGLLAPRCVPACKAGYHCVQLNSQPGGPILPPICVPN